MKYYSVHKYQYRLQKNFRMDFTEHVPHLGIVSDTFDNTIAASANL